MREGHARKGAPALETEKWLNTDQDLALEDFRKRVVVLEAFQMLCPGCVSHGLPQVRSVRAFFSEKDVVVIGLHTVFEHHAANSPETLKAFLHENQLTFPVAIDKGDGDGIPRTMQAYQLRGTPSLILIDQKGRLASHWFGQVSDLELGARIASLLSERG